MAGKRKKHESVSSSSDDSDDGNDRAKPTQRQLRNRHGHLSGLGHSKHHHPVRSFFECIEGPAKTAGKVIAWSAPLILAGLEIRHELHNHGHKRRLMKVELERGEIELENDRDKRLAFEARVGKKEGKATENPDTSYDHHDSTPGHTTTKTTRTIIRRRRSSMPRIEYDVEPVNADDTYGAVLPRSAFESRRSPRRRVGFSGGRSSSLSRSFDSYYRRSIVREADP